MREIPCPICGGKVGVADDALPGELFECEECSARLEYFVNEKGSPSLIIAEHLTDDWRQ